ncbi:uncharacterized protein si:dkey-283b1.6 [Silurus meridionalis]|uniref:Uncharacterized protein n=1 Tax=Silurus meridionalis TaxID=175797 RepID=A0A8T0AYX1_SILME|nr:uncharacterized protein si:dkey-283b1.6 [Silurus meridionalis]XP_046722314.1 uncharacterized protein si:dkey-283b1.6 [Silurus meridionalis]XP_046722315.1 uncharacterized protein si:dkey-283b1.6 [Silurus meridionalis]KAF7697764.1 hypothetical protein HF521_004274 [Silurus meridionalis]
MDTSLPLIFRIFQILIPTFAVIVLCTGLCKCFIKRKRERRELAEASARAVEPPQSVYVIPHPQTDQQQLGHLHYRLPEHYTPPPLYNEIMKPEIPNEPPPSYTESIGTPFVSSEPGRITSSCPPLPQ